jgi:opacity protein-like surface antigen
MNTFVKSFFVVAFLIFSATFVSAQSDYFKVEGFAGYAYMNLDRAAEFDSLPDFNGNRVNSHGFNGSVTYNFSRHWGAKFDLSLHTHGEDFQSPEVTINPPQVVPGTFKISQSDYQYMGGVQWKDNSKDGPKFKPFGHVLLGVASQNLSLDRTAPTNAELFKLDTTDFAMKFGAGFDVKLSKNIDARVFQFDFNPIWRGEKNLGPNLGVLDSGVRSNYMLTFGIVFH